MLNLSDPGFGWNLVRLQLQRGDPPSAEKVAALVRVSSIPDDLRTFVADMLERKVRRKNGRKPPTLAMRAYRMAIAEWVFELKEQKQRAGEAGAFEAALYEIGQEIHIAPDTLRKWCYPGVLTK